MYQVGGVSRRNRKRKKGLGIWPFSVNVIWLPPQAIRNFNGRRFAVVQDGDVQRRVDIKIGIQAEERVEIEEGLQVGQTVVGP